MKITFKDVGQGDSIILEWVEGEKTKIGIIDCSNHGGRNPVLKHVRDRDYKEVEFIVLSHPHLDHYSGMPELLDYFEKNRITVKRVAHTLDGTNKKYWKYFEVARKDSQVLKKLINRFAKLRANGIISMMDVLVKGTSIPISGDIKLECLAPTHDELEEYMRRVKLDPDENIKEASKAANYLSTIFRLKIDNSCFLFTSDAETFAFDTIIRRGEFTFNEDVYLLCQLPHHGSENNHHEEFWAQVGFESKKSHAAISAGQHKDYCHPSLKVVEHFDGLGYVVNCTNIVHGMKEFTNKLEVRTKNSRILDGVSTLAPEYRLPNDRVYLYENGSLSLLSPVSEPIIIK